MEALGARKLVKVQCENALRDFRGLLSECESAIERSPDKPG